MSWIKTVYRWTEEDLNVELSATMPGNVLGWFGRRTPLDEPEPVLGYILLTGPDQETWELSGEELLAFTGMNWREEL